MKATDRLLRVRKSVTRERLIHEDKFKFGDAHSDRYHLGYAKALLFIEGLINCEIDSTIKEELENE